MTMDELWSIYYTMYHVIVVTGSQRSGWMTAGHIHMMVRWKILLMSRYSPHVPSNNYVGISYVEMVDKMDKKFGFNVSLSICGILVKQRNLSSQGWFHADKPISVWNKISLIYNISSAIILRVIYPPWSYTIADFEERLQILKRGRRGKIAEERQEALTNKFSSESLLCLLWHHSSWDFCSTCIER